jgi:hypothetical protein
MSDKRGWSRIVLLLVLGYEGAGALAGGVMLAARPDGSLMDMPVRIMHGAFADFFVPGLILLALGALNAVAFVGVLRRSSLAWIEAGLGLGGLAVWFIVEIGILRELHWLHAMWGLPVLVGLVAAAPLLPFGREVLRRTWLVCGVASSGLYLGMNVGFTLAWPGFDSAARVVSALSAVGAPTRPLWIALGFVYTLLFVAFGWGVWMSAGDDRRLRVAGRLLVVFGALSALWVFAPMHLREDLIAGRGDVRDPLHIALGAVTQVFYLGALAVTAAALGRWFRIYSLATLAGLVTFGALTFRDAPLVATNVRTLIGVWERTNIALFLAWVVVLALALLRRGAASGAHGAFARHDFVGRTAPGSL